MPMRARSRRVGSIDHIVQPLKFLVSQVLFIAPALFIAAPLVWPRAVGVAGAGR